MSIRIGLLWPQGGSRWVAGGLYYENLLTSLMLAGKRNEVVIVEPPGGSFSADCAVRFPEVKVVTYDPPAPPNRLAAKARRFIESRLAIPYKSLSKALREARIDVAFGDLDITRRTVVPWVAWIPDFQHLHYPEYFGADELRARDEGYAMLAQRASLVLLSSEHASGDLARFLPGHAQKARVAPFVSLFPEAMLQRDPRATVAKYRVPDPYVVVPNQWWVHKNHRTAIEAAAILRDRGTSVSWVMTGALADFRSADHVSTLLQRMAELGVQDRMLVLGVLPRAEQIDLVRAASMVVQPSLFEGWSTVVEDAKTLGQRLVVSDIEVHREQQPPAALFFSPTDPQDLADKIEAMLAGACERVPQDRAIDDSLERARAFGQRFYEICAEAAGTSSAAR